MVELRRVSQLDGLRGIAILMVFFYHAFNIPVFWSGVDLFFVLSGYLITGVLLRLKEHHGIGVKGRSRAWRMFYLRRGRRIFPPYVGFLLAVSLVYAVPWAKVWYFYVFFGANVATLLYPLPFVAMIPLWSLAVEEQFYFVWPTVVFLTRSATLKKVALGVIVTVPVLRAICTLFVSTHDAIYFLTPFRYLGVRSVYCRCTVREPRVDPVALAPGGSLRECGGRHFLCAISITAISPDRESHGVQ